MPIINLMTMIDFNSGFPCPQAKQKWMRMALLFSKCHFDSFVRIEFVAFSTVMTEKQTILKVVLIFGDVGCICRNCMKGKLRHI